MATPEEQGLVWITEAMVRYQHSRNWFNNRIKWGIFEQVPALGSTKVYLREDQVDAYLREHPEQAKQGGSGKSG
ncbi:MAG TPA: hypothetical protein VIC27_03475 [Ktedonobacterales bacterium]